MSNTVRIFISSPTDVAFERARAERVAERLTGLFDGLTIETYRYEAGRYFSAHTGFQPQIPEIDSFDIVVGLFWSRVGSALPPDFPRMADGRAYPSGTAYEVLTAIEQRRQGRPLPDVLVYRKTSPAAVPTDNTAEQQRRLDQLQALNAFIAEWFVNEREGFKAAFTPFQTPDEFEALFEQHLRAWLRDHRRLGRERHWRVEERGSPFVGLEAFGPTHEAVFFGRRADVERARERLEDAAAKGCAFLMIEGASGAGKSSLVRAGLLPRLGVLDPDLRTATLRPGGADPLASLAAALFDKEALPQLAEGDYPTTADLAAHFAGGGGIQPILRALDRAGAAMQAAEQRDQPPPLRLALLADQLEELFAKEVPAALRARFAETLAALARSGRAVVVATMRVDARAAALAEPALQGLIDEGASLALAAPGPEVLDAIVRGPAQAAGLAFERHDGQGLDEVLIRAAASADALPLLQFMLDLLYRAAEARVRASARRLGDVGADEPVATLAFADYAALGGLEGAVRQQAEAAFAKLSAPAQAALPRLVRALTDLADAGEGGGTPVLRAAALAAVAPAADAPEFELVDALVTARILVREGESIRFAHEKALTAWDRAATAVDATFLRVRADVERAERRWRDGGQQRSLLLPAGVRLAEAEVALKTHGDELPAAARAYVRRSRGRARLGQTLTAVAAVLFAAVAIGAGYFYLQAAAARDDAEQALRTATRTANTLVFELAQKFKDRGLPSSLTRSILEQARRLQDDLAQRFPDDAGLQRSRAAALIESGQMLARQGDGPGALEAYEESLAIARALLAKDPDNTLWARDVSLSLDRIGDMLARQGDAPAALQAYEESLAIRRALLAKDPDNTGWARDVTVSLANIGDVRLRAGDAPAALQAYEESLAIARALRAKDPENTEWARDVSSILLRIGDLRLRAGDAAAALEAYEEGLAIRRALLAKDPENTLWAGGVGASLERIGNVRLQAGDAAAALEAFEESLAIGRALRAKDPDNTEWARYVSASLDRIGDMRLRAGDAPAALQAFEEGLAISRALRAKDPDHTEWARDVTVSLDQIGDVRLQAGDAVAALQDYEESLAIRRALLGRAPPDAVQPRTDLALALAKVAQFRTGEEQRALLAEALALLEPLEQRGALPADQRGWPEIVRQALAELGPAASP